MKGPRADLLQKYNVIDVSDNVKILSYCDDKILCQPGFLILVNEGITAISNTSTT